MKEQILVFDEKELSGFSEEFMKDAYTTDKDDIDHFFVECLDNTAFADREMAETQECSKQVIPYAVIRAGDKYLAYKRTKAGGEGRLHEKWSIGVGGHINPQDAYDEKPDTAFAMALARELEEELFWKEDPNIDTHVVGLLYDSSNTVGRVHFGVVIVVLIDEDKLPVSNEDSLAELTWLTLEELKELKGLENWSQLTLNMLEE